MRLKPGVRIAGIRPEMVMALAIVDEVLDGFGVECVITSLADGKHSRGSLHYVGCAADIRIRAVSESDRATAKAAMQEALGVDFDVVDEGNHWHIEFDPKTGVNT